MSRRATVLAGVLPRPTMSNAATTAVIAVQRPARSLLTRLTRRAAHLHFAPMLISSVTITQKPGALCTAGRLGGGLPVSGRGLSAWDRRGQVALDGGGDAGHHLIVGERRERLQAQDVPAERKAHELGADQRRAPLHIGVLKLLKRGDDHPESTRAGARARAQLMTQLPQLLETLPVAPH